MSEYILSSELKKVIYLLREYYETNRKEYLSEIFRNSKFFLEKHWNTTLPSDLKVYNLSIRLQHKIFIKNADSISLTQKIITNDINRFSDFTIDKVTILPDYEGFEIVDSEIRTILTDWDEINQGQKKLFELLSSSSDSLDMQNIGNTARTIMLKLSNIVYDPARHKPNDPSISVTEDKFKNRLTSYIKKELKGDSNNELKKFAEAAIESVEKSINLANTVTHKIGVERIFAEVCVIGTIGAISIIKLIYKQSTH